MARTVSIAVLTVLVLGSCGGGGAQVDQEAAGELEALPRVGLAGAERAVVDQLTSERRRLEELLERSAETAELSQAFGHLGQIYHAYDLLEPAGACYRNAHRMAPESFRWLYYLASLYRRQGRLEESRQAILQALAIEPDDPGALLLLGHLELSSNRPETAASYYQRALELEPRCGAARYGLGEASRARGAFVEAVEHYERALEEQPGAVQIHYPLAQALSQLQRAGEAARHLDIVRARRVQAGGRATCPIPLERELTELATGAAAHLARGVQAGYRGALEVELEEYRQAVALSPEDAVARQSLGSALYRRGEWESAAHEFRQAVALEPASPSFHHDLGQALLRVGRVEEAAASFRTAVKLDPAFHDALLKLAELELQFGASSEALRRADELIRLDPGSSRARALRVMVHLKESRRPEAAEELATLLDRYPPTEPTERLQLAMLLGGLGDRQEAERHISAVVEVASDPQTKARAHLARGQIRLASGDAGAAVVDFQRALELDPELAAARAALLQALARE